MAIQQHRITTPVQETKNLSRIRHFTVHVLNGRFTLVYETGDDTGGSFVTRSSGTFEVPLASLPGAIQTDFEGVVAKALSYLAANNNPETGEPYIPAGTQEDLGTPAP